MIDVSFFHSVPLEQQSDENYRWLWYLGIKSRSKACKSWRGLKIKFPEIYRYRSLIERFKSDFRCCQGAEELLKPVSVVDKSRAMVFPRVGEYLLERSVDLLQHEQAIRDRFRDGKALAFIERPVERRSRLAHNTIGFWCSSLGPMPSSGLISSMMRILFPLLPSR